MMKASAALRMRMKGLVCPPITPYNGDGSINFGLVPQQIKMIEDTRASAVFLGGTASEGPSQTLEERIEMAKLYKQILTETDSNMKLVLHVGATSLVESQKLAAAAEKIGVDAIASVTPTFFKPANLTQMIDWMGGLASAAPSTPFYYYHIPVITGVPATISVKKFLEEGGPLIPTLHGVKYTSTNLAEMADVASVGHGKYDVMAGLGEQMLAALAMGAESAVSAPFNVPFAMGYYHRIQEQFAKGDMKEALKLQKKINQFSYVLQWGGYGHPISTMRAIIRHEKGLEFGSPRLPLKAMSAESAKKLCDELKGLGFLA